MSFSPRFHNRGIPLAPVLGEVGELALLDTPKVITVVDEGDLIFGDIAVATEATIGLEYVSTDSETFLLGVGLRYTGDAGAFTISAAAGTGDFTTPIALTTGVTYWMAIPPDTSGAAPNNLTITALQANQDVAKSGTLAIVDRFTFDGGSTATRTLGTITMSKTTVA
jgi:hypothetical protein